jgi:nucleotide-binding universal stress UspA family protein
VFERILIATDGSDLAERAASQSLELARVLDAKVTAVTVTEPWTAVVAGEAAFGFPRTDYEKSATETAAGILARVAEMAKAAGLQRRPCTSRIIFRTRGSSPRRKTTAAT